jgi:hypothetical protein
MSEVLAIGFLKNELLKAAARKREQTAKFARSRSLKRRPGSKSPQDGKEPGAQ